jgi:hypothetical protein
MERRTAWVHADEAKCREAIGVPLNDEAMAVLNEEKGKHPECVFTYKGRPLSQLNARSERNDLRIAEVCLVPLASPLEGHRHD